MYKSDTLKGHVTVGSMRLRNPSGSISTYEYGGNKNPLFTKSDLECIWQDIIEYCHNQSLSDQQTIEEC